MRKDIQIDIDSNDIVTSNQHHNTNCEDYTSILYPDLESGMQEGKVYIECYIKKSDDKIYAFIPYTPIASPAMIRFHYNGAVIKNKFDGGYWFDVCHNSKPVNICSLNLIAKNSRFNIIINQSSGTADIYALDNFDFSIDSSIHQDSQMLLKLNKLTYLKEPTSGMGIERYLNGTVSDVEIKRAISEELNGDGINVDGVYIDENNSDVMLEVSDKYEN